jgi:hypothetical protein
MSSIYQGLYKVAEVTGTKIQNIKYTSIYINTQPGCWGLYFPAEGLEGEGSQR